MGVRRKCAGQLETKICGSANFYTKNSTCRNEYATISEYMRVNLYLSLPPHQVAIRTPVNPSNAATANGTPCHVAASSSTSSGASVTFATGLRVFSTEVGAGDGADVRSGTVGQVSASGSAQEKFDSRSREVSLAKVATKGQASSTSVGVT